MRQPDRKITSYAAIGNPAKSRYNEKGNLIMLRIRSGPSALAISAVALFMSMGGTSYALSQASGSPAAAVAQAPVWHNLTLTGGWVYGGFNSTHAAYFKDSTGVVHLRGSAINGSTISPAFRLPRGARPSHELWLSIYASRGSSGGLHILPNGNAFFFDNVGGANVTGASGWSSLDGVTFPVP